MRLLYYEDGKFQLKEFDSPPPYAILSHTWSEDNNEEVTYQDIIAGTAHEKRGFEKLLFCRDQAIKDGHGHYWIDTCCINKKDEPETSCAIRSMYRWYAGAKVCYVYLPDVSSKRRDAEGNPAWQSSFRSCRWFTRGWTLQELLAPAHLEFYARDGRLGDKQSLCSLICEATNLPERAVSGQIQAFDHATRLSWISSRTTKREEDLYYCLSGICEVSMGARYGEGRDGAHERLTRKIVKKFGFSAMATSGATRYTAQTTTLVSDAESRAQTLDRLKFDTMESRRNTIKKAQAKTCQWILSHPGYLRWLDPQALSKHHGFFWIKGKPGVGKSVLVKYIDQHITKASAKSDIRLSFYFNARGQPMEKSFLGLYRSLLVQLLLTVTELQPCLDALRSISTFEDATVSKLQDCFSTCLGQLQGRRIHCFIDALDECQEEDVHRMIEFFQDLQNDAIAHDNMLYVIFASRHYPIMDIPDAVQLVLEDTEAHRHDLCSYITDKLRLTTPKQTEELRDVVVARAKGIFLWVVIVVDLLSKLIREGRMHDVYKRLAEIPQGLPELFESILLRDKQHLSETILCLQWILYAKRPLKLREFYFAMMAGIDPSSNLELHPDCISDEQMHAFLLSTSKDLAELTRGGAPTAQFIHESVRDFLLGQAGFRVIDINGEHSGPRAHEYLKQCCLTTLRQALCHTGSKSAELVVKSPLLSDKLARISRHNQWPFLYYATINILHHANEAATEVSQLTFLTTLDVDQWCDHINFFQTQKINLYTKPLDIVYICAERDLVNLVMTLATAGFDLARRGTQRNGIPLLAALAYKCQTTAQLILERTGCPESFKVAETIVNETFKGRQAYDLPYKKQAWQVAMQAGHEELAIYFINYENDKMSNPQLPEQVLADVVHHGRSAVLKRLLETEMRSGFTLALRDPRILRCVPRHASILRSLIERNVVSPHDFSTWASLLNFAVRDNIIESARMLITTWTDDPKTLLDGYALTDETPLMRASQSGNIEMVDLLLQSGASTGIVDGLGLTALVAACLLGHTPVVEQLLRAGASVETAMNGGTNPLGAALHWRIPETTPALEQAGTTVSVLRDACHRGDVDAVIQFLKPCAPTSSQDCNGSVRLQPQAADKLAELLKILIDSGARLDTTVLKTLIVHP